MAISPPAQLVGRAGEIDSLDALLADLARGRSGAVVIEGEPGIGKTRLLGELAARADERGCLTLTGSAAELEADLPYWAFVDALDDYVHALDPRRMEPLDDDTRALLANVLPTFGPAAEAPIERFRVHRAVRRLLEALAGAKPLVLVLDDVHWADSGSVDLIGTLLRRPPERVLLALAVRPRQMPERLTAVLERSVVTRLHLMPLDARQAREMLGSELPSGLFEDSGGNPFYLQQLARFPGRDVSAALADELALLAEPARRLLQGAAVAGDPFEPELAAAAAGVGESDALDALDHLLGCDLVRPTDVPRRFRFRHPLVRSAVYESAPAGWRLGAHERCSAALAELGAGAPARAHHVEQAGRMGDADAIAVLREAGDAVVERTPAGAARWYAAALRLLPATATPEERISLLMASAGAQAAAGRFAEAAASLAESERLVPDEALDLRAQLINAHCLVLGLMGDHRTAHARLVRAERLIGSVSSASAVALLWHLGANAIYRERYKEACEWGARADAVAKTEAEHATAAGLQAMSAAIGGDVAEAIRHRDRALAADDADPKLANLLASAELYLGRFDTGIALARRAMAIARATGQVRLFPTFAPIEGKLLFAAGRLGEAAEVLDGAVEAARLSASPQALAWVLFVRSITSLYRGDLEAALAGGQEGVELGRELDREGVVTTWTDLSLGIALGEAGRQREAVETVTRHGGLRLERVPGIWRAFYLDRLVASLIALGRRDDAAVAAQAASDVAQRTGVPFAIGAARRAQARLSGAGEDHLAAAEVQDAGGAPVEAAISRVLAGAALSEAGERERGAEILTAAGARLEGHGALRYRDAAERELGKLGRRRHRRTRAGTLDGDGVAALTERELEVARLIVDRRTNPQIAAELFLSQKTVESHVRNLFHKLGVSSRVDVARVIERAGTPR